MTLKEYIIKNWDKLPKSKFDDVYVVIFKTNRNGDYGFGHHDYEGLGMDKGGNVMWMFSSGCSCTGGPWSADATNKSFVVDGVSYEKIDPESINFKDQQVEFNVY